jgi:hypothetical protein
VGKILSWQCYLVVARAHNLYEIRDLHIGSSSHEEFTQVSILDNRRGTVTFRDPVDDVSTAIYMIYISLYMFR